MNSFNKINNFCSQLIQSSAGSGWIGLWYFHHNVVARYPDFISFGWPSETNFKFSNFFHEIYFCFSLRIVDVCNYSNVPLILYTATQYSPMSTLVGSTLLVLSVLSVICASSGCSSVLFSESSISFDSFL